MKIALRLVATQIFEHLELLGRFPLHRVSRSESASPATGSPAAHKIEHQRLMDDAFGT